MSAISAIVLILAVSCSALDLRTAMGSQVAAVQEEEVQSLVGPMENGLYVDVVTQSPFFRWSEVCHIEVVMHHMQSTFDSLQQFLQDVEFQTGKSKGLNCKNDDGTSGKVVVVYATNDLWKFKIPDQDLAQLEDEMKKELHWSIVAPHGGEVSPESAAKFVEENCAVFNAKTITLDGVRTELKPRAFETCPEASDEFMMSNADALSEGKGSVQGNDVEMDQEDLEQFNNDESEDN